MRITLITQDDPFYLPPALDELCRLEAGKITGVVVLPSFNETLLKTARRLYDFYGPIDFVRLCLRFATAKICDRINRIGALTRPFSAGDVARRHGIPVYQPDKINAPEFLSILRDEMRPDLIVSVAASQVFRRDLLEIPTKGCINLHSAPLPRYQGMMPNFWTLFHGEPHATVTVHYMAEQLDAGDIILQREVEILPQDSLHDLMVHSKQAGVEALREAIALIAQDTAPRRPMDQAGASYFSFPTRADAKRLRAQKRKLL